MALPRQTILRIKNGIDEIIGTIGVEGPTKQPKSKDNRVATAYGFYLWYTIRYIVNKKYEEYKNRLVKEGIIWDHNKSPRGPQPETDLVTVDYVKITLEVARPYPNVLETRLLSFLKDKIPEKLFNEAIEYASHSTKPAHTFRPYLMAKPTE